MGLSGLMARRQSSKRQAQEPTEYAKRDAATLLPCEGLPHLALQFKFGREMEGKDRLRKGAARPDGEPGLPNLQGPEDVVENLHVPDFIQTRTCPPRHLIGREGFLARKGDPSIGHIKIPAHQYCRAGCEKPASNGTDVARPRVGQGLLSQAEPHRHWLEVLHEGADGRDQTGPFERIVSGQNGVREWLDPMQTQLRQHPHPNGDIGVQFPSRIPPVPGGSCLLSTQVPLFLLSLVMLPSKLLPHPRRPRQRQVSRLLLSLHFDPPFLSLNAVRSAGAIDSTPILTFLWHTRIRYPSIDLHNLHTPIVLRPFLFCSSVPVSRY